jgi:hypothetical protein
MRAGWTCQEVAEILDVHPHSVTQALDPALRKIALLWSVNPTKTMLAILDKVEEPDAYADTADARSEVLRK